jgi:hypothetical protein
MNYRKKIYVCFDPDNDLHCWNVMKGWNVNGEISYDFHHSPEIHEFSDGMSETAIKRKLREQLRDVKVLVVLIGNNTLNLLKYVRWEIEYAIEKDIPIIGVNLNTRRFQDDLCPPFLRKELVMFIAFGQKIMDVALKNWPESHCMYKEEGKAGPYHYFDSVYAKLWRREEYITSGKHTILI